MTDDENSGTVYKYALTPGRWPNTWASEWSIVNGIRASGSDIPEGYIEVSADEYYDAVRHMELGVPPTEVEVEQQDALDEHVREARAMLIAGGMTEEQAIALVPDQSS